MSFLLSNGRSAHTLSTEALVDLYRRPQKKKDKPIIAAVLKSRSINIERFLFLKKLAGNKPWAEGDRAWIWMDGDLRECQITKVFADQVCDILFTDNDIPRGNRLGIGMSRLHRDRISAEEANEQR